jgi:hypothetical protein
MDSLLLVGGGGHCLTVIESLQSYMPKKIGIIDKVDTANSTPKAVNSNASMYCLNASARVILRGFVIYMRCEKKSS